MKKTLLICGALLALTATLAQADGLNLSWGACGAAGTVSKTFACTSNTLTGGLMIGSYIPPAGISALTGIEIVLDVASNNATLDPWWQFKAAGTCRLTSLGMNFSYGSTDCADYFSLAGGASGNLANYNIGNRGPNTARILGVASVDQTLALPVDSSTEYFAFNLTLNGAKTTGLGACAGCLDPVCIVLNNIKLTQPAGVGDFNVNVPALRQHVTWQTGASNCPGATPTQSTTWGSVKALYR